MKYKIWLNDYDQFTLACIDQSGEDYNLNEFDTVAEALVEITRIEQIDFEAKFSESYMLDVLTYNHGLQIEVLD